MTTSNVKATIPCDVQKVWETVSTAARYAEWRSDVSKTEAIDEKQFTAFTKDGYSTSFTITAAEPLKRWELDMENSHVKGHWTCVLTSKGGETEIDLTACAESKQLVTRPVGKSALEREYLKKELEQFVTDLKGSLG